MVLSFLIIIRISAQISDNLDVYSEHGIIKVRIPESDIVSKEVSIGYGLAPIVSEDKKYICWIYGSTNNVSLIEEIIDSNFIISEEARGIYVYSLESGSTVKMEDSSGFCYEDASHYSRKAIRWFHNGKNLVVHHEDSFYFYDCSTGVLKGAFSADCFEWIDEETIIFQKRLDDDFGMYWSGGQIFGFNGLFLIKLGETKPQPFLMPGFLYEYSLEKSDRPLGFVIVKTEFRKNFIFTPSYMSPHFVPSWAKSTFFMYKPEGLEEIDRTLDGIALWSLVDSSIKKEPSFLSKTIETLPANSEVQVLTFSEREACYGIDVFWMRIELVNGQTGWTTAYNTEVYIEPNVNSKVLYNLRESDVYEILEYSSELIPIGRMNEYWYKIRYKNTEGWVNGAFLWEKIIGACKDFCVNGQIS
jgi:hypothetical protein